MAGQTDDSLHFLEQKRLQLEEQIAECDRMLTNWRSWETDYEILKEDVVAVPVSENDENLHGELRNFQGSVLNSEELKKVLADDKGTRRSRQQLLDLLRHRLDYVKGNVDSISKQREKADDKLRAIDVLIKPDMVDEEGLPLTEITEELDEEDNVISSSTRDAADGTKGLLEELESASLGKESSSEESSVQQTPVTAGQPTVPALSEQPVSDVTSSRTAAAEALARAKADQLASSLDDDDHDDMVPKESEEMTLAKLLSSIADVEQSQDEKSPLLKLKDASHFKGVPRSSLAPLENDTKFVIPANESPEDAALRREMLEYSLNEVGSVVAEMNMEQGGNEDFDEDDDEFYDSEDNDDEDDDDGEDSFGRSRRPMLSEEYRKQMLELEKQLDAKALQNVGPGRISPTTSDDEAQTAPAQATEGVSVATEAPQPILKKKKVGGSKGVRFAEDLDIAHEQAPKPVEPTLKRLTTTAAPNVVVGTPLADEVQERKPRAQLSVSSETNARKVSRFKASRASEPTGAASSSSFTKAAPRGPLSGAALDSLKPVTNDRAERFASTLIAATADKSRETPGGPPGKTLGDVTERQSSGEADGNLEEHIGFTGQALDMEHLINDAMPKEERLQKIHAILERQRKQNSSQKARFDSNDAAEIPVDGNDEESRPKMSRFKAARLAKQG